MRHKNETIEERLDRCLDEGYKRSMIRFRQKMFKKGIVIN